MMFLMSVPGGTLALLRDNPGVKKGGGWALGRGRTSSWLHSVVPPSRLPQVESHCRPLSQEIDAVLWDSPHLTLRTISFGLGALGASTANTTDSAAASVFALLCFYRISSS
jgi:hypothetical protein